MSSPARHAAADGRAGHRRDAAALPDFQQNFRMAQFRPLPPEQVQLRAALRGNQEETNRFFLAYEGMIPPESFFNRENLGRIMATATATATA